MDVTDLLCDFGARKRVRLLALIVELFKTGMKELRGVSDQQIQAVVDYMLAALPGYLKRALSATDAGALREAA